MMAPGVGKTEEGKCLFIAGAKRKFNNLLFLNALLMLYICTDNANMTLNFYLFI